MRATGPRISRRALLAGAAATLGWAADSAQEAWELVTRLAAALERSNAGDFLRDCDPAMPSYADLRVNVSALVAQADAESAIDPIANQGDDRVRSLEVDWSLHLTARAELLRATDRRSNVKLRVEKRGRAWKATAIEPVAFFRPPSA